MSWPLVKWKSSSNAEGQYMEPMEGFKVEGEA